MTAQIDVELRNISLIFKLAEIYRTTIIDESPKQIRTKLGITEQQFNTFMKTAWERGEIIYLPHHTLKRKMYMFKDDVVGGFKLEPSPYRFCLIDDENDEVFYPDRHINHSDRNDCITYPADRWANYSGVYEARQPETPKTNNQLPEEPTEGLKATQEEKVPTTNKTTGTVYGTPLEQPKQVTLKQATFTMPNLQQVPGYVGSDGLLYDQTKTRMCRNTPEELRKYWKKYLREPMSNYEIDKRGLKQVNAYSESTDEMLTVYYNKKTGEAVDKYGVPYPTDSLVFGFRAWMPKRKRKD